VDRFDLRPATRTANSFLTIFLSRPEGPSRLALAWHSLSKGFFIDRSNGAGPGVYHGATTHRIAEQANIIASASSVASRRLPSVMELQSAVSSQSI
jgi:hypothetical protein